MTIAQNTGMCIVSSFVKRQEFQIEMKSARADALFYIIILYGECHWAI